MHRTPRLDGPCLCSSPDETACRRVRARMLVYVGMQARDVRQGRGRINQDLAGVVHVVHVAGQCCTLPQGCAALVNAPMRISHTPMPARDMISSGFRPACANATCNLHGLVAFVAQHAPL